ncbi:hypothetical protein AB1N83_013905, partial [Pleurotus pulmonarius]
PVRLSPL